jgi:lysyl endopeptidase
MRLMKPVLGTALLLMVLMTASAWANTPTADQFPVLDLVFIDHYLAPVVDAESARFEDEDREQEGLPPRFAIPFSSEISTATHGTWEDLGNGSRLWRLHLSSPGAVSINLGFTSFDLPEATSLLIYAADRSYSLRPYTAADNDDHGEFWTPVVLADDIVIELTIAESVMDRLSLEIGSVNIGYRGFGEMVGDGERSGYCNNDVVCPEGDLWRSEIPSVGVISTGGGTFCTGFMVNNTAQDGKPFFMTANHCGISLSNDQSLVVYWNFESPSCGAQCCGSLADNQSGSLHKASYSGSDFTLVELDDMPDPEWGVTYAGWDRTSADATSAVAIHHPSTDEKSISFENQATTTTSYLSNAVPGDGTHVRVTDWDDGTTEPGSSGSPLFDQNHRVVGQLHGGYASCSSQTSDWYGRFSVSWTHGLSSHLDPIGSGATTLNTFDPNNATDAVSVLPARSGLLANVPNPFNPKTEVRFTLSAEAQVELAVFDVVGRRIATLHQGGLVAGEHSETWNGTDSDGRQVSSGIYFARLVTDGKLVDTSKLTLLK